MNELMLNLVTSDNSTLRDISWIPASEYAATYSEEVVGGSYLGPVLQGIQTNVP